MSDAPAPSPPDHDEELLKLSVPKKPRSVFMALSVIGLAGLVTYELRADLRFAFCSKTPHALGDVRGLSGGRDLEDNSFVTIDGIPDRRNALFIEERGARSREAFFRLLGTPRPIFVRALDSTDRTDLEDRFTGRLRHFDSQPYAETLRTYFAKETHAVRSLDLERLRQRLEGGTPNELLDRSGRKISISSETTVRVILLFPEDVIVRLAKDKFPTAGDAEHEIERLGFAPAPRFAPTLSDGGSYAFILSAPVPVRNQVAAKLERAGLSFSAHEEPIATTLAALSAHGPELHIGERMVAWQSVRSVAFDEPIVIGDNALVLTEGERPGNFWWVPIVEALLIAFALFNVWYLTLAARKRT
jgi:hypothetical protein